MRRRRGKRGYTERWFNDNRARDSATLDLIDCDETTKERIEEAFGFAVFRNGISSTQKLKKH